MLSLIHTVVWQMDSKWCMKDGSDTRGSASVRGAGGGRWHAWGSLERCPMALPNGEV